MLAPGDYLTQPVPPEPPPRPPDQTALSTTPPAPAPGAEEAEPRSFLLTLLRALGAIHT
jgi:hypothetical protein